jgi:hypothetical protein
MGSFYTNITLRGPAQASVAEYLNRQNRDAYVSPTANDCTVVYDAASESQDTDILEGLTSELSRQFGCPALAILNHDDDILWYKLYESGQLVDEYDSAPSYFDPRATEIAPPQGGDAQKLCGAFKAEEHSAKVEEILRAPGIVGYLFAVERHEALAEALGIPEFSVGCGYNYIEADELPEDLSVDDLQHTGGG